MSISVASPADTAKGPVWRIGCWGESLLGAWPSWRIPLDGQQRVRGGIVLGVRGGGQATRHLAPFAPDSPARLHRQLWRAPRAVFPIFEAGSIRERMGSRMASMQIGAIQSGGWRGRASLQSAGAHSAGLFQAGEQDGNVGVGDGQTRGVPTRIRLRASTISRSSAMRAESLL